MARLAEGDGKKPSEGRGRQVYIDALLTHRRPPPPDDRQLLKRIDAKTAQHRSPFSANISRQHASILSALSPGDRAPKRGHQRTMTPTREASTRRAFEVFEWDRDMEPYEGQGPEVVDPPPGGVHWDTPPEPRPALTKYLAHLEMEEREQAPEEPAMEPEPELVLEAEDLIGEEMLTQGADLAPPAPPAAPVTGPATAPAPPPETTARPVGTRAPAPADEVVVEGRPGRVPREGGEFPEELMEPLDDAGADAAAVLDAPHGRGTREEPHLFFDREMDISDEQEASTGETETEEAVMGLGHSRRWPSDTGLELHIDGFEHMSAASDLCPRCGRRVTARNRLLTCNDCGTVACESCEMRTDGRVDAPYYYEWRFDLPLCTNCFDKAFNIQKGLAKAKAALGMGNYTYAFYHAQQALRTDIESPYVEDAKRIIDQVDRRRRESAEADEKWRRQRAQLSRTSVFHEE